MTTLGIMKTRIADEIVRDDLASQIGNAISTAIALWSPTRFHFNEKRFALVTVSGTEYYALSSLTNTDGSALSAGETLIEIDTATVTIQGQPYPLLDMTQTLQDRVQTSSATYTGQPVGYGIYADQLRLFPIPDAAYTCAISGLAQLATLSSDSAGNGWMTDGEALIRNQAKVIVFRDIVRDAEGAGLAAAAMAEAYEPLRRRMAAKATTGRIAPWGHA